MVTKTVTTAPVDRFRVEIYRILTEREPRLNDRQISRLTVQLLALIRKYRLDRLQQERNKEKEQAFNDWCRVTLPKIDGFVAWLKDGPSGVPTVEARGVGGTFFEQLSYEREQTAENLLKFKSWLQWFYQPAKHRPGDWIRAALEEWIGYVLFRSGVKLRRYSDGTYVQVLEAVYDEVGLHNSDAFKAVRQVCDNHPEWTVPEGTSKKG